MNKHDASRQPQGETRLQEINPGLFGNTFPPISLETRSLEKQGSLPEHTKQDFTENNFWTPQTYMLQSIQNWFLSRDLPLLRTALSIDQNPTLDEILLARWPALQIQRAIHPPHDAQHLTHFRENQFDLIYSHQVIEHLPKPWLAASEFVRILRPGGIGLHTTCAFNPRHGLPAFNDYYRFLPDGLAALFDGVVVLEKGGWGNRQALIYNLAMDDGHGTLGGRRFHARIGQANDPDYPWSTWIIFQKKL